MTVRIGLITLLHACDFNDFVVESNFHYTHSFPVLYCSMQVWIDLFIHYNYYYYY